MSHGSSRSSSVHSNTFHQPVASVLTPLYTARRGRWYMIITVELNVECVVLEDTRYAIDLMTSGDMTPSWGCCYNWLDCYRYAHFNRQTSSISESLTEQQSKARQCVPTAAHGGGGCRGTGTTRLRERHRERGSSGSGGFFVVRAPFAGISCRWCGPRARCLPWARTSTQPPTRSARSRWLRGYCPD